MSGEGADGSAGGRHELRGAIAAALEARPRFARSEWLADPRRTDAAVLLAIVVDPEPSIVTLVRSRVLRDHAGEVALPGGKPEASDRDLAETATREAHEEIGLAPSHVDILGTLSEVPTATSRYRIHPFVALATRPAGGFVASPEVARIQELPIRALTDGTYPFRAVPIEWGGVTHYSPYFELDSQTLLFGATAYVVVEFLISAAVCFGFELPAPHVVSTAPWVRGIDSP